MKLNIVIISLLILGGIGLVISIAHWGIQYYDLSQLLFGIGGSFGLFFMAYVIYRFNRIEERQKEFQDNVNKFSIWWGKKEFVR